MSIKALLLSFGAVCCTWCWPQLPAVAAPADAPEQSTPANVSSAEVPLDSVKPESGLPEPWNLYGQFTFVKQYHPSFTSPYQGTNSLTPIANGEATNDLTLYLGVGLWKGGALYVNPEIDEGFGLSDTFGVAGYPSGEAYKVGKAKPYLRLPRAFIRQRFDLGGDLRTLSPGVNALWWNADSRQCYGDRR